MTLQKTKLRPPAYHKKISGSHHRQSKRYHHTYWPYLPLLLVAVLGVLLNNTLPGKHGVLGYATDMSIQSLLDDTNAQRSANGETALALNGQLDSAAQAKANDMAARDYWSHNTPDGQLPWTFMTAAGYNYSLAGENLAYGFTTASDALTGWMNSPEHRANILNAGYKEVGFGFINIANYQGSGPETLVVAMYGTRPTPTPVAAVQPVAPAKATASARPKASAGAPVATPTPTPTPAPATTTPTPSAPSQKSDTVTPKKPTSRPVTAIAKTEPAATHVARVQLLTAGNASWSLLATSLLGTAGLLVFLLRHGLAWHKVIVKGEHYIMRHPLLDVGLISITVLALILTRTAGFIR